MCGIAGKVSFNSKSVKETEIVRMTKAIQHRGPDDGGVYISPDHKVGLGNRRLAIIDLSPAGHMPMSYLDKYWITYNGEIYNFQFEKRKLQRLGYRFRSNSDTEVILALYDKYGVKCLDYLRGMFAFAIYDTTKQLLFCARDRIGKKPFKYYFNSNVFIFASELKAILTQPEYHKEPDFHAIHHYLTLQYCPAPTTGFKNIQKLEPAHYLILDIKSGKLSKHRYWRLDYSHKQHKSDSEWCKEILSKLEESVKLRMISDVPLGAFLSGGIDSSAIVAMMAKNSNRPVKTFSIGFSENKFNELPYARIVADKFKTEHTEFIVQPENIDILPDLVKQYEEPYADSSALATYFVSKLTRKYVTVALNGDGGDENFAGYGRYSIQKFSLWYDKFLPLNQLVFQPGGNFLYKLYPTTFTERVRRFTSSLAQDYRHRYVNYICYFPNSEKQLMYLPSFQAQISGSDTYDLIASQFDSADTPDPLDQTLYTDINTYLPDDLQVKVDIATMAVSLEGRAPLLDHKFLEFTAQLPFSHKLRGQNNKKYIFKQALKNYLPDSVLNRPKQGFGIPIEYWFRGKLDKYTDQMLLNKNSFLQTIISRDYIRRLLVIHRQTGTNLSSRIWALLTLELWYQAYFA